MRAAPRKVWRCFPWDPDSDPGRPFSAPYLVAGQTVGRFDLHDHPQVRYLSDLPEHAIGEALSPFRGTAFRLAYLRQGGHQLALVEVTLASSLMARIVDCTDPDMLVAHGIRPDELAHHDRTLTQAIAHCLHTLGADTGDPAGLRWWSALTGAWHSTIVFTDRERKGEVEFGEPRYVGQSDPVLLRAMTVLGISRR